MSRYFAVPVDLRHDWPEALQQAGFDPSEPVAWAAEGLLPYLPAAGQDLLFERVHELSAPGSRIAVESFGAGFCAEEYLARRREQLRRMQQQAGASGDANTPDVADLWFIEERTDVADWLTERGWEVTSIESVDLIARYGRCGAADIEDASPRTVYVDGHLTAYPVS